ncbi:ATP-binding cassette domain-containing protein [Priestia filamentosa]|uniref:cell division ATP-binding protein FtsE n=1 Tax=Priestia filamentosa TaxID=1402861 RepID=UPI003978DF9E
MISLVNVSKKYNKHGYALNNISFKVEKGEFVFLVGKSGSGKSTIFKMLYKEEKPTEGLIEIFSKPLNRTKQFKLRRQIGVVFQDYKLLDNKTVFENVSYPLLSLGVNPIMAKKETNRTLKIMGIQALSNKKPKELSGGEQQRVAIARAIINKPLVLLCDEPTGNLDAENSKMVMKHLLDLNENGTTVIMTTHDKNLVVEAGKRVITLDNGILIDDTDMRAINKKEVIRQKHKEISKIEILKNQHIGSESIYKERRE